MSEKTALTVIAAHACMAVLADAISTLPVEQFKQLPNRQLERVDSSLIVEDPFVEVTQQDWLTQQMMSLLLCGNGFGQIIERDRMGYATQIKPQPRSSINVRRLGSGEVQWKMDGSVVPVDDVFHMRAISLPGELLGLSPIEYLRRTFSLGVSAESFAESFYGNSSTPSGVLEAPDGLSEDDVKIIAQQWRQAHQGAAKAAMPAVLSGAKWKQVSLSAGDAMFLESRQMTVTEMIMLYRVPPHMIGVVDKTTSWGAGIEQQEMGFVRNTLVSWARRFENALNRQLPRGQVAKFDFSHRLRGDTLQRAQAASLHRANGTRNIDELRAVDDLPPLPDGLGQDYLQPLNYVAIGSAAAAALAQAGTAATNPETPPTTE